jgi:hypothetical protein
MSPTVTVVDRITAPRKRRPRLIDEVVTLAHGAGGKSSAAPVDAVFVGHLAVTARRTTSRSPARCLLVGDPLPRIC